MKIFKILAVALVAMLGFTACNNEPEHIYDDQHHEEYPRGVGDGKQGSYIASQAHDGFAVLE